MSAFAMFALKDESLLRFDQRRKDDEERGNLERVFGIEEIPCDTTMREIIDRIALEGIKKGFEFSKIRCSFYSWFEKPSASGFS